MFEKLLSSASATNLKLSEYFAEPGDSVTLGVTNVAMQQATSYSQNGPGTPISDENGEPVMQYVITGNLLEKDEDGDWVGDDGLYRLFVPASDRGATRMEQALGNAMQASGAKEITEEGILTVTFKEFGRAQGGNNAPKIYTASYEPADDEGLEDESPWGDE